MERHTEILGILVDIGKTRIPWIGERLSNRNIYLHVADIVDSCADNNNKNDTTSAEMATPPPPLPPAFIRSKLRREILLERISKAKERVRLMLSFQFEGLEDNDAPLDELDEAIDQLLFQGFTADAIIEKKWPMSLVK